jgi:hypothetical protein
MNKIAPTDTPSRAFVSTPVPPSQTALVPTGPIETQLPLTPYPVLGLGCGRLEVQSKPFGTTTPYANVMEDCFTQAFRQCRTATLVVTIIGPDDAAIDTFTTEKQETRCAVVDSVQHYFFADRRTTKHIYTCDDFAQRADGLIFVTCGDESDILVPRGAN